MALWKGSIWKRLVADPESKGWRNIYVIDQTGAAAALNSLDQIALMEQAVHGSTVVIYREEVETIPAGSGFDQAAVNYVGAVSVTGSPLPLFNVIRVDILSGFSSRPERKYLRVGLDDSFTLGASWTSLVVSDTATNYSTPLAAFADYVTPGGLPHSGSNTQAAIQMRQIHWHRRFRPGFHRGYIANV